MERPPPKVRLHVLGLPHTVVSQAYSHCAFTGKILRFARMMQPYGYEVVEYSNGASESGAAVHVQILTAEEFAAMSARKSEREDFQADIQNGALGDLFWSRACAALGTLARDGDIVCHVFGPEARAVSAAPGCMHVESGIGYTCVDGAAPYRIYESSAWMHWHYGRRHMTFGANYEFVVPNYYDVGEWDVRERVEPDAPVLYFGRLSACKGLDTVLEAARRMPETTFVVCGQGDATPWLAPNVRYEPPVHGRARSALLGSAAVLLAPTSFIEPFCGAAVEAQMCGTPVVSTAFGAFNETVKEGKTGFLCHTLADVVAAIARARTLDRAYVASRARARYSLEAVGARYDAAFKDIRSLRAEGWYSASSARF